MRPCRQPEIHDRRDNRIPPRLRHSAGTQASALVRAVVTKHCKLNRRVAHTRQFEPRVNLGPVAGVPVQGIGICSLEVHQCLGSGRCRLHGNNPPRLRQADRGGKTDCLHHFGQKVIRYRFIGVKMPDIPPPTHQVVQLVAEFWRELVHGLLLSGFARDVNKKRPPKRVRRPHILTEGQLIQLQLLLRLRLVLLQQVQPQLQQRQQLFVLFLQRAQQQLYAAYPF